MEKWLKKHFSYKEIGWTELGEVFYRYAIFKSNWFNIYLHQLDAPKWHPNCHDHPWGFVTLLLKNGYLEQSKAGIKHRRAGSILFRPATFSHNVITPFGTSWSLIFTGRKSREWGFKPCERGI